MKKQVDKIKLLRVGMPDGRTVQITGAADSWERADEIIESMSVTAPENPKSHQMQIVLLFGDEEILLPYSLSNPPTPLRKALLQHVEFMAGKTRPSWMNEEDWELFRIGQEDDIQTYQGYLDKYDF